MVSTAVMVTLAVLALAAGLTATAEGDSARTFLATAFNVSRADMTRIDAGQVLSRTLDAHDPREVATFGVVRIRTTPEIYVERLADIATFKQDEAVLQIGTFSNPPRLEDVADLTLEDSDIQRLGECRVGNCRVQLPADAIDRFQKDVDWRRADASQQANNLMRHILVEHVTLYREFGGAASMEYADTPESVNLQREFISLVKAGGAIWRHFAGVRQHLIGYPAVHTKTTIDVMYWSKERVRQPVVTVTHLAISRTAGTSPADYAIASKQIYATHYFDASLGMTFLLRDRSASSPATYVAYLNLSRVDVFRGVLGGIARRIVTTRARSFVSERLARLQRSFEPQIVEERD
jgi:hypothetical protein